MLKSLPLCIQTIFSTGILYKLNDSHIYCLLLNNIYHFKSLVFTGFPKTASFFYLLRFLKLTKNEE